MIPSKIKTLEFVNRTYGKTKAELATIYTLLFTRSEIDEINMRFRIYDLIQKGIKQRDISLELGCSVTTICKVSKMIKQLNLL